MIEKINTNQIGDVLRETAAKSKPAADANSKIDAALHVSYESLVANAARENESDDSAVERARQLLLSGRLDTAENIRKAAENIIKYGI